MPNVEVYTQPWCPYCTRAMKLLTQKGIAVQEVHAPHGSAERETAMQRSGRSTMPQVFIGGHSVGGCDELMALERDGKLDGLLAAR